MNGANRAVNGESGQGMGWLANHDVLLSCDKILPQSEGVQLMPLLRVSFLASVSMFAVLLFAQISADKPINKVQAAFASQAKSQTDERAILNKEEELRQAHLTGDSSALERLDAEDFTAIAADGSVKDKAWVVAAYKSGNNKDEAVANDDVKVRLYDDAAVVTMRSEIKRHLNGRDLSGVFRITRVWERKNGEWRIAVTQSTRISS
jgi:hypothetical protein